MGTGALLLPHLRPPARLPVLAALPPFALTAHTGQPVTLAGLAGHAWVADFIFTRCGGLCPAMTARMARLRREAPAAVVFVSFTVDPRNDTPQVLARYARDLGGGGGWLFVTGPQESLYALAVGGFKLEAFENPPDQEQAGDGPFLHSSKLALVDGHGLVRGYYDNADEAALRRLVEDLRRLDAEGT